MIKEEGGERKEKKKRRVKEPLTFTEGGRTMRECENEGAWGKEESPREGGV